MTTATDTVTFGGWICTGRFTGKCHSCKTFLRVELEPVQKHETYVRCECGAGTWIGQVFGSLVEDKRCDARCLNAKGHDCECSCGGHNHGKGG